MTGGRGSSRIQKTLVQGVAGTYDGWMDFLTFTRISETATEVDLHALTGIVTTWLHVWENSSAAKRMKTKPGCTEPVHTVKQRLFFPLGPKEEMSGVHLASTRSITSPSGLELTGLWTEPRLHGDDGGETAALQAESEVSCKCLCSHSHVSVWQHGAKPPDLFKLTEAAVKLVLSVCPVLLKLHGGAVCLELVLFR